MKAWQAGGWTVERLRRYGTPATIIDVGAARGTPPLYDAFPDAHLVAIEPLRIPEYDRRLDRLAAERGAEVHRVAAGPADGSAVMTIDRPRCAVPCSSRTGPRPPRRRCRCGASTASPGAGRSRSV